MFASVYQHVTIQYDNKQLMIFQLQEYAEAYERMYETDMSGDIFICHRFGGSLYDCFSYE